MRKPTKPTKGSKERRIAEKKRSGLLTERGAHERAHRKREERGVGDEEEEVDTGEGAEEDDEMGYLGGVPIFEGLLRG